MQLMPVITPKATAAKSLSDAEFADFLNGSAGAVQPAQSPKPDQPQPTNGALSDEQFAAHLASQPDQEAYDGSFLGGILRSATQGATFDTADNVLGMLGGDAEGMRAKDEAFARENPWTHGIAKGAGMILPTAAATVIPGAQPAAGTGAVSLAGRVWNGVRWLMGANNVAAAAPRAVVPTSRAAAAISRVPFFGRPLGALARGGLQSHAGQGGIAAVKLGALDRAGMADTDERGQDWDSTMSAATGRAQAALDPAAAGLDYTLGAAGTGLSNAVISRLGPRLRNTSDALGGMQRINKADVDPGAWFAARQVADDGVSPDQISDTLFPPLKAGPWAGRSDFARAAVSAYHAADPDVVGVVAARKAAAAQLRGQFGDVSEATVKRLVDAYDAANTVPTMMHEAAARATDGGDALNTFAAYDVGIQKGGKAASRAQDFARQRQLNQHGRVTDWLEQRLGPGDARPNFQALEDQAAAANDLYPALLEAFEGTPEAGTALTRAINRAKLRIATEYGGEGDDIARVVQGHLEKFNTPQQQYLPVDGSPGTEALTDVGDLGTRSLRSFIRQRGALRDARKAAFQSGRSTEGRALHDLERALTDEVHGLADDASIGSAARKVFADWSSVNATRADAKGLEDAFNLGLGADLKARTPAAIKKRNEFIKSFSKLPSERQDMARRGVMTRLRSMLGSDGDAHDVAKLFTNDSARDLLTTVLGKDEAHQFEEIVRRTALATRTHATTRDTRSAQRLLRDEQAQQASRTLATLRTLTSPWRALDAATEHVANALDRQHNGQMMEILGASTDDPVTLAKQIEILQRAFAFNAQQQALSAARDPASLPIAARLAGPFVGVAGANAVEDAFEDRAPFARH